MGKYCYLEIRIIQKRTENDTVHTVFLGSELGIVNSLCVCLQLGFFPVRRRYGQSCSPLAALLVFSPTQSSLRIWVPGVPFPFESLTAPSKVLFPLTHTGAGTPDTRPLLGSLLLKAQPEHRGLQASSKVTGNNPLRGTETPLQPVLNPKRLGRARQLQMWGPSTE